MRNAIGTLARLTHALVRRPGAARPLGAWTMAVLVGSVALWGLASCGRRGSIAHHLVVISIDTARADHFGFYGNRVVRTPRLDAIARESIVFDDYMVSAPSTLTSHTSLFTGKYPLHHGTPRNGFMVNRDNQMLPEVLKRAGFHTAGFVGSFALASRFDFNQGFDEYDEDFDVLVGEGGADQIQRSAAAVTDAVIHYLSGMATPKRLFLFVHYFDAHQPYLPPAPFDTMYDAGGRNGLPTIAEMKSNQDLAPDRRKQMAARFAKQYAGEISYVDANVGRLLDDLRARGILDDALLVITSDHGENLDDRPLEFEHGPEVYQSTIRGVCAMRLPHGERGGTRCRQLESNIDVLPTILRYFRIGAPARIDGEAVDLGSPASSNMDRARFCQATKPWDEVETDPRWKNMRKARCVRQGRFKFIQTPYRGSEEFYDLVSDPGETRNLLVNPSREVLANAATLRQKLETWAASANPLPSRFEVTQRDETIRRLRSLGYVK